MKRSIIYIIATLSFFVSKGYPADWPAWRHDSSRTAVTNESLPQELHPNWSLQLGPNHIAWGEDPRLQFDASYQPIVVDRKLIVASARTNSVTAVDTGTGKLLWKFQVSAPVRFAPVAHRDRIYFGADNGTLYCLDKDNGELIWELDAAPNKRLVIGNERLISVWPVRGGPVILQNRLFFSVGVWPFEGTLLCHVDLDEASTRAVPKLHTKLLEDLSPQGYLTVADGKLLLPCGRANVACLDAESLTAISTSYSSRGKTDVHVTSDGNIFFHGDAAFDLAAKAELAVKLENPLANGKMIFGTIEQQIVDQPLSEDVKPKTRTIHKLAAFDLTKKETTTITDRRGKPKTELKIPRVWTVEGEEITLDNEGIPQFELQAADRLYGYRGNVVFALELSDGSPQVTWKQEVPSPPSALVCADEKLFVVTSDGWIHMFSGRSTEPVIHRLPTDSQDVAMTADTKNILANVGDSRGYCVSLGIGDGKQIEQILRHTQMQVVVVDADEERLNRFRRRLDTQGHYGPRATCLHGSVDSLSLPPYLAQLVLVPQGSELSDSQWQTAFEILRPYGGSLITKLTIDEHKQLIARMQDKELPRSEWKRKQGLTVLSRVGALPGAADWTHEYGDSSNTLMSHDERVRAPFGVLWFGGPASHGDLFFNRHYWGPGLTVVEGQMYVQGPQRLAAIDIYTGRILWKKKIREGSSPGRRGNFFEKHKPGFHFVASSESVYVVYPEICLVIDPKTGDTQRTLRLDGSSDRWGKVRVWQELLIVTVFREDGKLGLLPKEVRAVHRTTGKKIWSITAKNTIPLVAAGGNDVYLFDGYLPGFYDAWKRRGLVPKGSEARFVKSVNAATGEVNWEKPIERVTTWMAYSPEHDVLVASNKRGIDAFRGDSGKLLWSRDEEAPGFGGHPENVWDKVILSGDVVIDQRGPGRAYNLHNGESLKQAHPVSGDQLDWEFTKTGHHCNYAIASPHLITFRAGTAGFFDRSSYGTGRLPGFRSGCRNSLIPAGGVLNAPNYAHGCVCSYNLFTSLALVHLPDADLWTYNALPAPKKTVKRLGVNFGAPGDRLAEDGTLWMEYPAANDPSARMPITVQGLNARPFRIHSADIQSGSPRWIGNSGMERLEQLNIQLSKKEVSDPVPYTVRLFFVEPDDSIKPGARVFDVSVQGQNHLKNIDIAAEAGGSKRIVVKELANVLVGESLVVEFNSQHGQPVISGIEVVAIDN